MSSYKNTPKIDNIPKSQPSKQIFKNCQKIEQERNDSSINNTNNELSLKDNMKNENVKKKKKICLKALIIGISIILVSVLIVVIILMFQKRIKK